MIPTYGHPSPIRLPPRPAAPTGAVSRTNLATNPNIALALAQSFRDRNQTDAELQRQQALASLTGRIGNQRLNRSYGLTRDHLLYALAARGGIRSGDTGFQQQQLGLDYADKRYDLNASILQSLANAMSAYLAGKTGVGNRLSNSYLSNFPTAGS